MNKTYLIKKGNNGATYIFNTKNINSIVLSLKFYKTFTFRQYLVKAVLFSNLFIAKYFSKSKLLDIQKVKEYLKLNTLDSIDFDIDENSSILISPTNDKIIIHNHDKNSFIKYAFGKSLDGVKNESNIYKLFENTKYFNTSKLSNFYSDENYCNFELINEDFSKKSEDLVNILVEFFELNKKEITLNEYINTNFINIQDELKNKLLTLFEKYDIHTFNIGLVHKDFKPWNINITKGSLIYDFEETILAFAGEDLINYYIDSLISYESVENIINILKSKSLNDSLKEYSKKLNQTFKNEFLISHYLIERIYFWGNKNKKDLADKYFDILKAFSNE